MTRRASPFAAEAAAVVVAELRASRQGMTRMVEALHRAAESRWQAERRGMGEAARIACLRGCDWCCRQKVAATFPEAVLIAEHLRALPTRTRERLVARLRAAADATRGLSVEARRQRPTPCPFSEPEGCAIYAVRPLSCRSVFSVDADVCRACVEDPAGSRAAFVAGTLPPAYLSRPEEVFGGFLEGASAALRKAGFDMRPLELNAAVRALLDSRAPVQEWLRKAPLPKDL